MQINDPYFNIPKKKKCTSGSTSPKLPDNCLILPNFGLSVYMGLSETVFYVLSSLAPAFLFQVTEFERTSLYPSISLFSVHTICAFLAHPLSSLSWKDNSSPQILCHLRHFTLGLFSFNTFVTHLHSQISKLASIIISSNHSSPLCNLSNYFRFILYFIFFFIFDKMRYFTFSQFNQ